MTKRDVEERQVEFEWALKFAGPAMRAIMGLEQKQKIEFRQDTGPPPHWIHYKPSDFEQALDRLGVKYVYEQEVGTNRHGWAIRDKCLFSDAHTDGCYVSFGEGRPGAICHHSSCEDKSWKDAEPILWPGENPAKIRLKNEANRPLTIYSADEALEPQPPPDWLVQDWLTVPSTNIVYGQEGSKKTYLLLALAIAVAADTYFLDRVVMQGNVLFVDEESGNRRMLRRIRELRLGMKEMTSGLPFKFTSLEWLNLGKPGSARERLENTIREVMPLLVIIDALADVMDGDENAKADTHPVFQYLRQISERFNCTVIIIHHENKSKGYRGSSAVVAATDTVTHVVSEPKSSLVAITMEKNRDGEPGAFAAEMLWEPVDDEVHVHIKSTEVHGARKRGPTPRQQVVLDQLTLLGPMADETLKKFYADRYGTNENTARVFLNRMQDQGWLEKTGDEWSRVGDRDISNETSGMKMSVDDAVTALAGDD